MKITIVTNGIPNESSEQAHFDPLMFMRKMKKSQISFDVICIIDNQFNTSKISINEQINLLKKEFKNVLNIHLIRKKKSGTLLKLKKFFLRLFTFCPYHFYGDKEIFSKTEEILNISKPNIILNFFELPALTSAYSKLKFNCKIFNYIGAYRKKVELYRIKNLIREGFVKNLIKILNALIYVLKIEFFYKKIFSCAKLNFIPPLDTYLLFKKKGIKNLYHSESLANNLGYIKKKKNKIPKVLLIGNLRSTFMQDSLNELAFNLLDDLKKLYKKHKFEIRIVGKYYPKKNIRKILNYKWIKFVGWVKNSDTEYALADYMFTPNSVSVATRTKILEAISCGIVVITYSQNIKGIYGGMIDGRNIIISYNPKEFVKKFYNILKKKSKYQKISKNAKILYNKKYNSRLLIEKNLKLMLGN